MTVPTGRPLGKISLLEYIPRVFPQWEFAFHNDVLINELQDFADRKVKRLMVFMPPRHGKSLLCSVILPSYIYYLYPGNNVMLLTYGEDLSSGFGGDLRKILLSDEWQSLAGTSIRKDTRGKQRFELNNGSKWYALGRDGAVTGKGAEWLFCDDMVKNREEADNMKIREKTLSTYKTVVATRLNNQDAAVLHLITRWRKNDLPGSLLAEDKERPDHLRHNWKVVRMPALAEETEHWTGASGAKYVRRKGEALWPEKYDRPALAIIREELGSEFTGLYQQRPAAAEGEIFKRADWKFWTPDMLPTGEDIMVTLVSLDTAFKDTERSDYTVGMAGLIGMDGNLYLLGQFRDKLEFIQLKMYTKQFIMLYRPDWTLIEDKGSGTSLYQELIDDDDASYVSGFEPMPKKYDKRIYAQSVKALVQRGRVFLPKDPEEPEAYALRRYDNVSCYYDYVKGMFVDKAEKTEEEGEAMLFLSKEEAEAYNKKLVERDEKMFGGYEVFRMEFPWWDEDWVYTTVDECAEFPNGDNDDIVDTLTQKMVFSRNEGYFDSYVLTDLEVAGASQ